MHEPRQIVALQLASHRIHRLAVERLECLNVTRTLCVAPAAEKRGTASRCDKPKLAERLRLVVDEGHELAGGPEGEKKSKTRPAQRSDMGPEASAFVAEIFAERRWVVSGTPTTGDIDDPAATTKHLDQLQKLMKWLRHPDYGLDVDPRLDGAAARVSVDRGGADAMT